MVRIQKANVILDVEPEEVQHYMARGFNVIDAAGNILQESMPNDVVTLQKFYREHKAKIEELEATIEKLKSDTSAKKPAKASSKKSES